MRSGFEKTFSACLKHRGLKFKYEPYTIPYTIKADYIPDFVLTKKDGSDMLIETKGYLKPSDRLSYRDWETGKSGLHRTRCWLMTIHGDVRNRATETSVFSYGETR